MKYLVFCIILTSSLFGVSQNNVLYFDSDSYVLTSKSISTLDEIVSTIKMRKIIGEIAIIGHTDKDATEDYNQKLALNRARTVREYLLDNQVNNRFHLLSKGELSPVNNNLDDDQKAYNRRVEIILDYQLENFAKREFEQETQKFKIGPYEASKITTKYGTEIKFDKDIFDSVLPHLTIKIHIQEFYDKASFVLENLTTETTDNKRLESKGMINIYAIQKGDTLNLKKGKSFEILFPDKRVGDDAQLFEGVQHNDEISWDQTTFTPSRSFGNSGWSVTYIPHGDTLSRSKWWYENIDGETFKIQHSEDLRKETITVDTMDVANEELMGELMMTSTTMGWINCDRFWNDNSPKEDVIVEFEGDFVPSVSIVFDDINSVLPYSYREDNKLVFENIPINRSITFIGLHREKNSEEILFAVKKGKSSKGLKEKLYFEVKDAEQIKTYLSKLN